MEQPPLTKPVPPRRLANAILRHLNGMEIDGRINTRIFSRLDELDEWFRATERSYIENKGMPLEYSSMMIRAARNGRQVNAKLTKILKKVKTEENNSLLAVDALHVFTALLPVITLLEESQEEPYTYEKRHDALEKIRILRETAFDASMLPSPRDMRRDMPVGRRKELLAMNGEILTE